MKSERETLADQEVLFLGEMIACISHELKNALATIHETSGLLTDILAVPGGVTEEVEEIRGCADSIAEDLGRTFRIIRNLNRFAHSADKPLEEIDVAELVELTASLAGYVSFVGVVRLEWTEVEKVRVITSPLLLEGLVYRILVSAFRVRGHQASISLTVRGAEDGAEIQFSDLGRYKLDQIVSDVSRRILDALRGNLVVDPKRGELRIRLPLRIEEAS